MSLPVGAYKRAKLIARGMYGAELTNAPGYLRKKVRTCRPSSLREGAELQKMSRGCYPGHPRKGARTRYSRAGGCNA
eukprot:2854647-Heterocapsa_arctica.AAC.1